MEAGWSQRRVADAVGVDQKTVSNLSNNGQVAKLPHLAPSLLADAVSILNGDAAIYAARAARRARAVVPATIPNSAGFSAAQAAHSSNTGQDAHNALAGRGSSPRRGNMVAVRPRHAASCCQSGSGPMSS